MKTVLFTILGIGTLSVALITLKGMGHFSRSDQSEMERLPAATWTRVAQEGNVYGPGTAPVQIVKFFDYACRFCYEMDAVIESVISRYGDSVSVTYRHLPLSRDGWSYRAALAAECAAREGSFLRFHKSLFNHRHTRENWYEFDFETLGIMARFNDVGSFQTCMDELQTEPVILRDRAAARELNIRSVPVTIINGLVVRGAVPAERIDGIIRPLLDDDG